MFVRKSLAGVLATSVAGAALVLTAGSASAEYRSDPDDPGFTPAAADLVGVGSDTTQHAVHLLAQAWNADASHGFKIASFAATEAGGTQKPGNTISVPGSADIARPNGSGAGKGTLWNPSVSGVDFARSSDSLSTDEANAGLKAIPFALDTVVVAVSGTTTSHAPATISAAQLVDIYQCKTGATDWSSFGGQAGTIQPMAPQSGSGTAKFFLKQLVAANGGNEVKYGSCVKQDNDVQEHDDTLIKGNPNAIVPFSKGRAELKNGTVRVMGGFKADRALYNVVRGADIAKPEIQAVFGENGFFCSAAANALIAQAGFKQLATSAHSGVCGTAVTTTSNFTTNEPVSTATALTATVTGTSVKLVAKVTAATAATGTVDLYEGSTLLADDAPLVSGQATLTRAGQAVGTHSYRAVYTPDDAIFLPSEGSATAVVKAPVVKAKPVIGETFPAKVKLKKKAKTAVVKGLVTVKGATGKVSVKKGAKVLKTGVLKAGKAGITLPKLKKGSYKLTIAYAGDATHLAGTKVFTIKVVK